MVQKHDGVGGVVFTFSSPQDFANWLQRNSDTHLKLSMRSNTIREARYNDGIAYAYRDLAEMIACAAIVFDFN